jgi:cyclopropane fatty-acyl-phospholipid synthase-like methyltransferase
LTQEELPAPAVRPDAYDEEYYRTACSGYEAWAPSEGREIAPAYSVIFKDLGLRPGGRLVDIGTGRGELLAVAAEAGVEAVGVDYSEDAVALAQTTLRAQGVEGRARVVLADARSLPVDDDWADAATLLDVVEHLTAAELDRTLAQAKRILKPGGKLFIHTFPNRTVYEVTYRLQRILAPWRLRTWPANPRLPYEQQMHVNEQTVPSLARALRAHFGDVRVWAGDWIHTEFVPSERAKKLYHRLAKLPTPLDRLGRGNIWAEARKQRTQSGVR